MRNNLILIRKRITVFTSCLFILLSTFAYGWIYAPPENLNDAILDLKESLTPEDIELLKTAGDDELACLHHGLGAGLRKLWGLRRGTPLAEWFKCVGITEPEDMSSIVIESLVRDLRGERRDWERRLAEHKECGKYDEEKEANKEIEREERLRKTALKWRWSESDTPVEVEELPHQASWKVVQGLIPYSGGFIVTTINGYRKNYNNVWHDGIYFLADSDSMLEEAILDNCEELHDVVVRDGIASWLCRSYGQWLLIYTAGEHNRIQEDLHLDKKHDWLRLAKGEKGLLLVGSDRIYRRSEGDWHTVFKLSLPTKEFPQVDPADCSTVFKDQELKYSLLPQRSATLFEHGEFLYFQSSWSYQSEHPALFRLKLGQDASAWESVGDFLDSQYIGCSSADLFCGLITDSQLDSSGNLWMADLKNLFQISKTGEVHIVSMSEQIEPENRGEKLPAGAILFDSEEMYLAGVEGIARISNGNVERLIAPFGHMSDVHWVPYLTAHRLGRFADGSFLIGYLNHFLSGERYGGLYVVKKQDNAYKLIRPAISQSRRQMYTISPDGEPFGIMDELSKLVEELNETEKQMLCKNNYFIPSCQ